MKLSVRKKVANGLVLFLLVPKGAVTAGEILETYAEGFSGFSAEDDFDLSAEAGGNDSLTITIQSSHEGEDPTGGDPTGGDPTGGDPTGGDPTGGDPTGGDPTGGDPTGGDPTGGDPTGGDPSGYDPSAFDPSGYDPSGGDPSGCEPASSLQQLVVNAPRELVTAEDGSADLFEVYMPKGNPVPQTFHIVSDRPDEALPYPDVVQMDDDACIPKSIQVIGQNDYFLDGDQNFTIEVLDVQDLPIGVVPGVNLDNDDYRGVAVDVLGPTSLPQGGSGLFLVRVANVSGKDLTKNTLAVETTAGLHIRDFATAFLSGAKMNAKGRIEKDGSLLFENTDILTNDVLVVSIDATLDASSVEQQTVAARYRSDVTGQQTDDDVDVRSAVPEP